MTMEVTAVGVVVAAVAVAVADLNARIVTLPSPIKLQSIDICYFVRHWQIYGGVEAVVVYRRRHNKHYPASPMML
jgi:hypothetical protein